MRGTSRYLRHQNDAEDREGDAQPVPNDRADPSKRDPSLPAADVDPWYPWTWRDFRLLATCEQATRSTS